MKTLFLILFIPVIGLSQVDSIKTLPRASHSRDTLLTIWRNAAEASRGNFILVDTTFAWRRSNGKTDTIPVIMLVCDTMLIPGSVTILFLDQMSNQPYEAGNVKNRIPYCWWQFGYYIRYSGYLDENKKPLSPSIVVWESKILKHLSQYKNNQ